MLYNGEYKICEIINKILQRIVKQRPFLFRKVQKIISSVEVKQLMVKE